MTFFLKPQLIPTLFTIPAVIILLALGTWQVQRLNWKNARVDEVFQRSAEAPTVYAGGKLTLEGNQYRRYLVEGMFDHTRERHLYTGPKVMRGTPGYNLFTPLVLANGDEILVDRGWVSKDQKQPEKRPQTRLETPVSLETMLHKGEIPSYFTPENDSQRNLWYWADVGAMLGSDVAQDVFFRALKTDTVKGLPLAGDTQIEQRNDHLQYAITWYSLAIILIVIYGVFHMRVEKR